MDAELRAIVWELLELLLEMNHLQLDASDGEVADIIQRQQRVANLKQRLYYANLELRESLQ